MAPLTRTLVGLGLALVATVALAAVLGRRYVREELDQKARGFLLEGHRAGDAAERELIDSVSKTTRVLAELPVVKAAAQTGDGLTVAQALAEVLESLELDVLLWFPVLPGGTTTMAARLEPHGAPPRAWVRRVAGPEDALFGFGPPGAEAAGTPPEALPGTLPGLAWAVEPLAGPALVPAGLAEASLAPARATTGPGPVPARTPGVMAELGTQVMALAGHPVRYAGRPPLGILVGGRSLTGDGLVRLAAAIGRPVAVLAGREASLPTTAWPSAPGLPLALFSSCLAAPRAAPDPRGSTAPPRALEAGGLLVSLSPLAGSDDRLWRGLAVEPGRVLGGMSLEDLRRPLGVVAVFALVGAVLMIPVGVRLWIARPVPAAARRAPRGDDPTGPGRRVPGSALARALECFPEDRYGKPETLGKGGMGIVVKLTDKTLARPLALKVLDVEAQSPGLAEQLKTRFLREAKALAALSHPALPLIHAIAETPVPHFVMEYLAGESLQVRFLTEGVQPAGRVRDWLVQAAAALEYTHGKGIIHRDIKPANLMLDGQGRLRVIDFGIALLDDTTRVTQEGRFVGTLGYAAPEQAHGQPGDARSDLFALAATGYYLLSGRFPYTTPQLAMGKGFPPAPLPAGVEPTLAAALARALAMDPAERPADMAAFVRSLEPHATRLGG